MTDVLLAERRTAGPDLVPPRPERRARSGGRHWIFLLVGVALAGALLSTLLFNAVQADHRYDHARHVLAVTRGTAGVVAHELAAARTDLHLVSQQVGQDSTALAQYTSQLEGARSALSAAQTHVVEQAALLNALNECLGGVEQALNALAVGSQSKAADALKWVSAPCSTAVNASG